MSTSTVDHYMGIVRNVLDNYPDIEKRLKPSTIVYKTFLDYFREIIPQDVQTPELDR